MKSSIVVLILSIILFSSIVYGAMLKCDYYDGEAFEKAIKPIEGSLKGPSGCYTDIYFALKDGSKNFLGKLYMERADGCFYHFNSDDPDGFSGGLICSNE